MIRYNYKYLVYLINIYKSVNEIKNQVKTFNKSNAVKNLLEMINKYEIIESNINIEWVIQTYNKLFNKYKLSCRFQFITNKQIEWALRQIRAYSKTQFSKKDVLLLTDEMFNLKKTLLKLDKNLITMDGLKTMEKIIHNQYRDIMLT